MATLVDRSRFFNFLHILRPYNYQQKLNLVNVKLKWVKDTILDSVVSNEKDLMATSTLISILSSYLNKHAPIYHLTRHRGLLDLPYDLKVSSFIRRYPSIFNEFHLPDSAGTPVPWFQLTQSAIDLHQEELNIFQQSKDDILHRLVKLLMLTKERTLPLQTINQLRWDIGLPYDYKDSFIPLHPQLLSFINLPDDRVGLRLLLWDDKLAISEFEKTEGLSFPVKFTRGFGLKRKCMAWLDEWQRLDYTSPYVDSSHLDPRTDISEKRNVGVFHELLHLTLSKQTQRKNVSNLRKPLSLPFKFTKVFERHPGIFYISRKGGTQTVVLREGYDCGEAVDKHPMVDVREKYARLMQKGFLDRSKGLYKKGVSSKTQLNEEEEEEDQSKFNREIGFLSN
ncbi:protein WHAT'S THIS FACTOR 9, mitochondrial [Impatiens glandulifera]|uniref:protein WHAT'S THIS FACTOR 9, mitochondrial n=1 Tax=Impatiens glandulifera TaxID=253017 RepID=UPI001FB089C1|nr:protein WHAT'S THIS FACTOR 9, mitochondrial [Impatiens glandulifera]